MSRHLVRSFILASVFSPLVNAGPCKPLSSSTVLGLTTIESTEIGIASSSTDVAVFTSETYTLTSRSEDVSTTTTELPSSTVSESVLFTTTAETSAISSDDNTVSQSETATTVSSEVIVTAAETSSISSDDTTVSQGETTTTAVFEASTTAASDLASDTTTETAGDTTTEISATISSDETSVVSQTATTTTFEYTTTTVPESSTTEEVLPTTTDITTLTSEAPTTTTTEDVTLTSTEPSETTTGEVAGCKDDKITPPPKNLVCGAMGGRTTNEGYMDLGRVPDSELDCAEQCRNTPNCKFFAVKAGQFGFCEFWSQVNPTSNFPSPYKWYEPGCFCGFETEPETTTTQASEVLPTTTDMTSETGSPTTTTEDVTLTSTEPVETTTEAATVCIDDKKSPPPEGLVCSKMGYSSNTGNAEVVGMGRFGSELECAEDCRNKPNCKWMAVNAGPGGFCQLWSGVFSPTDDESSWRWYEPDCFCDSSEPEPEATQEPEP
ncbi:hypothetical protein FSHL1_010376 [Fusarium sambucinum]